MFFDVILQIHSIRSDYNLRHIDQGYTKSNHMLHYLPKNHKQFQLNIRSHLVPNVRLQNLGENDSIIVDTFQILENFFPTKQYLLKNSGTSSKVSEILLVEQLLKTSRSSQKSSSLSMKSFLQSSIVTFAIMQSCTGH